MKRLLRGMLKLAGKAAVVCLAGIALLCAPVIIRAVKGESDVDPVPTNMASVYGVVADENTNWCCSDRSHVDIYPAEPDRRYWLAYDGMQIMAYDIDAGRMCDAPSQFLDDYYHQDIETGEIIEDRSCTH